jgi:hypothetical protein
MPHSTPPLRRARPDDRNEYIILPTLHLVCRRYEKDKKMTQWWRHRGPASCRVDVHMRATWWAAIGALQPPRIGDAGAHGIPPAVRRPAVGPTGRSHERAPMRGKEPDRDAWGCGVGSEAKWLMPRLPVRLVDRSIRPLLHWFFTTMCHHHVCHAPRCCTSP